MEEEYICEIKTIYTPPYKLDFVDYINCPICDFEIDVYNKVVDLNSTVWCDICEHKIQLILKKIN